jgi:hypothetical protein
MFRLAFVSIKMKFEIRTNTLSMVFGGSID